MTTWELIGSGREADVYAIDQHRVLRRYRHGGDVADEADVMAYLWDLDFPVPRVFDAAGTDLVLERLDGPTMAAAGDLTVPEAAEMLAGLHRRLHAVPPRLARRPGDRILHLDLHPENVMLTARGPVVIDWRNVREGSPDVDVALSAIILAEVAISPDHPLAALVTPLIDEFLRAAGGDPLSALDAAMGFRRTQIGDEASPAAAELVISVIGAWQHPG
ncbi:phosphotransferase [Actinoplanes sp. NPDC051861]|uniref:phosphotransferase n=1 Tax=Actinoplanes sp. NPDC051861 TaxID=3155170 RepID=UPI00341C436D